MTVFIDVEPRLDTDKVKEQLRAVVHELIREELAGVKESDK